MLVAQRGVPQSENQIKCYLIFNLISSKFESVSKNNNRINRIVIVALKFPHYTFGLVDLEVLFN